MFPRRVVWRTAIAGVLALAGAVSAGLLREASTTAEARSPKWTSQASSTGQANAVRVRVEAVATERSGITGRRSSAWVPLAMGQTASQFVGAGPEKDASFCSTAVSPESLAGYLFAWTLQTTPSDTRGGRSTLQIRWTRSRAGNPVPERDETRTITLGLGDTHVLDFVESPDAASTCASVLVRVSAVPVGPQAPTPIVVDLWTVDESTSAAGGSVHQRVKGVAAEQIDYALPPLDMGKLAPESGEAGGIQLDVSGTVHAVVDAEGSVHVTLATTRTTRSGKGTIQGQGRVQFKAKLGETAAVLLPEPAGRLPMAAGGGSIDVGRLFAGHRLSLYVRVNPAR